MCTIAGRFFALGDGYGSLGQGYRAGPVRGVAARVNPLYLTPLVGDEGNRRCDEPGPMTLILDPDGTDQFRIWIAEETQRIRIQRDVRAVLLAVAGYPLSEFFSLFRRLDAHPEDLDLLRDISFRFVHEGRYLGPTPGSPAAAVEENDGRGRFGKDCGKFHGLTVDVLQSRFGESFADR